ncbi:hypothetical protein QCA50_009647 [Cerrena zonata]|uniref:Hydrophobin n=1 Tax=Cerrena zonata TaxID=2478898 RepID=A0AAW0F864_9APHY
MSRISALMVLSLALFAVATPNPGPQGEVKRWGSPSQNTPTPTLPIPVPTIPTITTVTTTTTGVCTAGGGKPPATTTTVTVSAPTATSTSQCNVGAVQCCDTVTTAQSTNANALLGLLGIVVSDINALLGINCSPLSVIGIGGNSCSANPVCCENNSFGSLISIGCIPIIIQL